MLSFLEDASPEGLAIVGERIRSNIEAAIVIFEGQQIPVTASVGLAEGCVQGSEDAFGAQLFALADGAMYRAKNSGRNCFVVESMHHSVVGSHRRELCMAHGDTD